MTCTHAALVRQQMVDMRLRYDTLIMEEAAQVLEVETFVPMVLQKTEVGGNAKKKKKQRPPLIKRSLIFSPYSRSNRDVICVSTFAVCLSTVNHRCILLSSPSSVVGVSRLKRVVLIGDHNQLPPVVKNRVSHTKKRRLMRSFLCQALYPCPGLALWILFVSESFFFNVIYFCCLLLLVLVRSPWIPSYLYLSFISCLLLFLL